MITMITACGSSNESAQTDESSEMSAEESVSGGWEPAEDRSSVVIPQDAKEAFDKAAGNLDGNAEITNICTVDPADYNE